MLAAGAVLFAVYETARGHSFSSALGSYADVANANYSLGTVLHWLTLHFAELAFSVGVVPACALLLLVALAVTGRATTQAERAFLAVATAAVPLVVLQVAMFASRFSLRIEERYMFPLAPLLFLALVLWIARGLERPPLLAAIAAIVPVVLLLDVKLKDLLGVQILSDTFALIPVWRAAQLLDGGVDSAQTLLLVGSVSAAAAFLFVPRRFAAVLPLGVAAFLAFGSWPVYGAVRDYARSARRYAGGGDRDWIDDARGQRGARALPLRLEPRTRLRRHDPLADRVLERRRRRRGAARAARARPARRAGGLCRRGHGADHGARASARRATPSPRRA